MKSTDDILKEKCEKYLEDFEFESLPTKINRIFDICKPDSSFDPINDYEFNMDKIKQYDVLRHHIIHDDIPENCLPGGEKELDYLQKTNLFLFSLINITYNLKLNPTLIDKNN